MDCQHKTHPEIVKRLKRACGQLNKIITMLQEDTYQCNQIAQQMQAAYKAIGNAKIALVQDHIKGCVSNINITKKDDIQKKIRELEEITKYLS